MEIWKEIESHKGYSVSSEGRVRRDCDNTIKRLTPDSKGYLMTGFNQKLELVHRLVAKAFLLAENGKTEVNHKNGVKSDNRVSNLEWCTRSENGTHRCRVLGKGGGKPVKCIETGEVFPNTKAASDGLKMDKDAVGRCLRGYSRTCGGYHWEYV